jgi:hypothetical protein
LVSATAKTKTTAIDQSLRPSDFTPGLRQSCSAFGAAFIRRAEALRFRSEGVGFGGGEQATATAGPPPAAKDDNFLGRS